MRLQDSKDIRFILLITFTINHILLVCRLLQMSNIIAIQHIPSLCHGCQSNSLLVQIEPKDLASVNGQNSVLAVNDILVYNWDDMFLKYSISYYLDIARQFSSNREEILVLYLRGWKWYCHRLGHFSEKSTQSFSSCNLIQISLESRILKSSDRPNDRLLALKKLISAVSWIRNLFLGLLVAFISLVNVPL